jgi:hypothetical protein
VARNYAPPKLQSGERTRLGCWFWRPAKTNLIVEAKPAEDDLSITRVHQLSVFQLFSLSAFSFQLLNFFFQLFTKALPRQKITLVSLHANRTSDHLEAQGDSDYC